MSEETDQRNKLCPVKQSKDVLTGKCVFYVRSLVQNPRKESYQTLLDAVKERASLHDGGYVDIQSHLDNFSPDTFREKKPLWHRSCCSDATNPVSIQRARDHLQHAISTGTYTEKKHRGHKRKLSELGDSTMSSSSAPFTRSATEPLKKSYCFFCQKDNGQPKCCSKPLRPLKTK